MSKFYLKNVKRTMFVIINDQIFLSRPNLNIPHSKWFKDKGWVRDNDRFFMENNPRGYIDDSGIHIYQGYDGRMPDISTKKLKIVIKYLYIKLKINYKLHVFLGTIATSINKEGGRSAQCDLGSIAVILKKVAIN
ncbi:MAG: hypothetical protein Q8Q23_02025 [bacterium]|nr:hypothetical protein [bacterium]